MTEWHAQRELGKLYRAYNSALIAYWRHDNDESISNKRLTEFNTTSKEATKLSRTNWWRSRASRPPAGQPAERLLPCALAARQSSKKPPASICGRSARASAVLFAVLRYRAWHPTRFTASTLIARTRIGLRESGPSGARRSRAPARVRMARCGGALLAGESRVR
jgi:hypothetical protein